MARKAHAPLDIAKAVTAMGSIERDMKNHDAALQNYGEAVAIYRSAGDELRLAHAIRHIGDIYLEACQLPPAEPCYVEALRIYRGNPNTDPLDLANAIRGFALLNEELGKREEARRLWEEARTLYATVNVEAGVKESERRIAQLV